MRWFLLILAFVLVAVALAIMDAGLKGKFDKYEYSGLFLMAAVLMWTVAIICAIKSAFWGMPLWAQ